MRPLPFACVLDSLGAAVLVERLFHSDVVRLTMRASGEFYQGDITGERISNYVNSHLLGNPLAKQLVQRPIDRWVSDVLTIAPQLLDPEMYIPAVIMVSGKVQFVFEQDSHIDLETGQAWPAVRLRTQLPSGEELSVTRFYRGGESAYQRRHADFLRIWDGGGVGEQQREMYSELRAKLPESTYYYTADMLEVCPQWEAAYKRPRGA